MLKVAIISHMYPFPARPTYGQFIHEHVKALREIGVAVRVVAPVPWTPPGLARLKPKWREYSEAVNANGELDGVEVRRPDYLALPRPLHALAGAGMAAGLRKKWRRLMAGFECDLIHAHAITPDGQAAVRLARSLGLPVVCSARGSEVHQLPKESPWFWDLTQETLRSADGVIAVSRALAQEAVEVAENGLRPKVIYNGVTENFQPAADRRKIRQQLGFAETARVVLFVGRCERDKGAGELLEAFHVISRQVPGSELVFVGDGGVRGELEAQARQHRWGARVRFTGTLGRKEIPLYLQAADVFVLPSYGEGMPNALLEAMAAGLPCVATNVGGIPEAITDGVNGLLIRSRSSAAVAGALQRMFSMPDFAAGLGAAARRTIAEKFSWRVNAEEHRRFYEETIASWTKHKQQRH